MLAIRCQMDVVLAEDVDLNIVVEPLFASQISDCDLVPDWQLIQVNVKQLEELFNRPLFVTCLLFKRFYRRNHRNLFRNICDSSLLETSCCFVQVGVGFGHGHEDFLFCVIEAVKALAILHLLLVLQVPRLLVNGAICKHELVCVRLCTAIVACLTPVILRDLLSNT